MNESLSVLFDHWHHGHMAELVPTPQIPKLKRGQRLYTVEGKPWRKALSWFSGDRAAVAQKIWFWEPGYRDGDLLLTTLKTDPRMILCLEIADGDYLSNGDQLLTHAAQTVVFKRGISFDAVVQRSGIRIQRSTHYAGADAKKILKALEDEQALSTTWFSPDRWFADNSIHPEADDGLDY